MCNAFVDEHLVGPSGFLVTGEPKIEYNRKPNYLALVLPNEYLPVLILVHQSNEIPDVFCPICIPGKLRELNVGLRRHDDIIIKLDKRVDRLEN